MSRLPSLLKRNVTVIDPNPKRRSTGTLETKVSLVGTSIPLRRSTGTFEKNGILTTPIPLRQKNGSLEKKVKLEPSIPSRRSRGTFEKTNCLGASIPLRKSTGSLDKNIRLVASIPFRRNSSTLKNIGILAGSIPLRRRTGSLEKKVTSFPLRKSPGSLEKKISTTFPVQRSTGSLGKKVTTTFPLRRSTGSLEKKATTTFPLRRSTGSLEKKVTTTFPLRRSTGSLEKKATTTFPLRRNTGSLDKKTSLGASFPLRRRRANTLERSVLFAASMKPRKANKSRSHSNSAGTTRSRSTNRLSQSKSASSTSFTTSKSHDKKQGSRDSRQKRSQTIDAPPVYYKAYGRSSEPIKKSSKVKVPDPYYELNRDAHRPHRVPVNAPRFVVVAHDRIRDRMYRRSEVKDDAQNGGESKVSDAPGKTDHADGADDDPGASQHDSLADDEAKGDSAVDGEGYLRDDNYDADNNNVFDRKFKTATETIEQGDFTRPLPEPPLDEMDEDDEEESGVPQAVRSLKNSSEQRLSACTRGAPTAREVFRERQRAQMEGIARDVSPDRLLSHLDDIGFFHYNYMSHSRTGMNQHNLRNGKKKCTERLLMLLGNSCPTYSGSHAHTVTPAQN